MGDLFVHVQDFGDSEKVLKNRALLGENARALLKRGLIPSEEGWGGWLGRYQAALAAAVGLEQDRQSRREKEHSRHLSHGR
jgi:hypothetical protein